MDEHTARQMLIEKRRSLGLDENGVRSGLKPLGEVLKQAIKNEMPTTVFRSKESATRQCPHCERPIEPAPWSLFGEERWGPLRCNCEILAQQAEEAARIGEAQEKRVDAYRRAFPWDGMGNLQSATFGAFEARDGGASALAFAKRYAAGLPAPSPPGLLLWGPVGNGKSHLAAAIAGEAEQHLMATAWVHTPTWLRLIGTIESGKRESQIELATTADLLVMDELGGGKLTTSRAEWLLSVLDGRYRQRLPTVLTTNRSPKELELALTPVGEDATYADIPDGARIVDRLAEMSVIVENKASSFRQEQARRRVDDLKREADGDADS